MLHDSQIDTASEMYQLASSLTYYNAVEAAFVGAMIKTAARSGEFRCLIQHKLSDELASELESKGYTIKHVNISNAPQYIISWENPKEAKEEAKEEVNGATLRTS